MNEGEYLWDHFKFNADQRLKVFNFFVLLSIFAGGGVFTALEKNVSPGLLTLLGFFIITLSAVFFIIDTRSQQLLNLAIPGLKDFESGLRPNGRLFIIDSTNKSKIIRYTIAFRSLFVFQFLFGVGVAFYGLHRWFCHCSYT